MRCPAGIRSQRLSCGDRTTLVTRSRYDDALAHATRPHLSHLRSQHADYPAVLPYRRSRELYEHDLPPEGRVVRGTLVRDLEQADIELLDIFEGDVRPVCIPACTRFHIKSGIH